MEQYDAFCTYEKLFVFDKIFYEYHDIFKKCSMNNNPYYLNEVFGDDWDAFSKNLDKIFNEYILKDKDDDIKKHMKEMNKLYNKMVNYYEKHSKVVSNHNMSLVKKKKHI